MTEAALEAKLEWLLNQPSENEVIEFKEAKNSFDLDTLGKYFSALSNEANLKGKAAAWLVFGIEDKTHKIVGTAYKQNGTELQKVKKLVSDKTNGHIGFIEIHVLQTQQGRVVMFEIPPAPQGMPVAYGGFSYAREHENTIPQCDEKRDRIRVQAALDWSAAVVDEASINDLDLAAIEKARTEYRKKNPSKVAELEDWTDETFLNKAKLTRNGKVTRTAILLLGKEEMEHYLGSCDAKIRWILNERSGERIAGEIFTLPLLLAVDKIYAKIRNLKYLYVKDGTLFPEEVLRYDPFNIREPLNNCIAHRDYTISGRINVVEFENDRIVFSNVGTFIPNSVEDVVKKDTPEERYRNTFLVEAMRNLNMVETEGGGIKKVFKNQRERFFPLPEYDLAGGKVVVTIEGKVLDMEFARILATNDSLSLDDIMMLDRVQKKKRISAGEVGHLKKLGLIEGRKPNLFLSPKVVAHTKNEMLKADYLHNRSIDDSHFRNLILDYLKKFGGAKRSAIEVLLVPKLSDVMNPNQKKKKIGNLLTSLRKKNLIVQNAVRIWVLVKP